MIDKKTAEGIVSGFEDPTNVIDGRKAKFVMDAVGKIIGHKDHTSNFVGYHHYGNKILLEGKEYFVRLTVQEVKTRKKDFIPNQIHSAHITDVEIYNTDASVNSGIIDPATKSIGKKSDAKLQKFFESGGGQETRPLIPWA